MTYSVEVAGASGYAGGEVLLLLAAHPEFVVSTKTYARRVSYVKIAGLMTFSRHGI